jgi:autotransporter-associated beta strand protein
VATWSGGSGNWTNTSNWVEGFAAIDGVKVEYAGNNGTSNNNSTVGAIKSLTFTNNSTGPFTLGGGALSIGAGGIVNNSSYTNTIALDLTLGANQTFAANTGNLVVSGNISGNGGLTKEGNQTLLLSGTNSYTGPTLVSNGTVVLAKRASLYNGNNASWTASNITVGQAYGSNSSGSGIFGGLDGGHAGAESRAGQVTADDIAVLATESRGWHGERQHGDRIR